jgi:hypothetical protein
MSKLHGVTRGRVSSLGDAISHIAEMKRPRTKAALLVVLLLFWG